jgi:excisionase family DNA binding protein
MTLDQVAERTGRSVELLRRWCRDGRIPATLVGRTWVIREDDLDAIEKLPARAVPGAISVRPLGMTTDPSKAELVPLAAEIAAATGQRAKVASALKKPPSGAAGGEVFWQWIEVVIPHLTDALLGALTTVLLDWARRRYRARSVTEFFILGPDGKVIRSVKVKSKGGKPEIRDGAEDAP